MLPEVDGIADFPCFDSSTLSSLSFILPPIPHSTNNLGSYLCPAAMPSGKPRHVHHGLTTTSNGPNTSVEPNVSCKGLALRKVRFR